MDVSGAIRTRRAYRSLAPAPITDETITFLAEAARLSPSCFNNQPWRFVFVYEKEVLARMQEALSQGNAWARAASMIVAVCARRDDDCNIHDREYYLFDAGLATAFLVLRATELGLVAHPIAGYSPKKVREVLGIPDDVKVITLVIVGEHADTMNPVLSNKQREQERHRPKRLPTEAFAFRNRYKP
jgi:nitroreductase